MPKKILLADDSVTIQKVITITFSTEDFDLTTVSDGESAIRKAREIRPDLVMADVAMPGKSGYEVCDAVKKDPALKHIPVLLLAGTFEPLNKDEAARVKADDSIVKPFESQDLLDKVRELLERYEALAPPPPPPSAPAEEGAQPPARELEIGTEWEAGDFLGFPDAFEEKAGKETPPEIEFMETGGIFEEPKKEVEKEGPPKKEKEEEEFVDLVLTEEEYKEEKKTEAGKTGFEIPPIEPFEAGPTREEPYKLESFEPFRPEKKETAAPKIEAAKAPEAMRPEEEEFPPVETDLLEAHAEAAPEFFKEPPPPAPFTPPAPPAPPTVPFGIAEKAEERVKDEAARRLAEAVKIPKEEVEAIVSRIAKEVVEKVAWEVVPALAEEIISTEFNKLKEAWAKAK